MIDYLNTADVLLNGGVAVIPTDTIYGLVARAFDKKAVDKVYEIKNRDRTKPCIILIADTKDLSLFGVDKIWLSKTDGLWPGPNSLVFPTPKAGIEDLTKSTGSVALRLPDNDRLRDLIRKTGPLIATSANPEKKPPASNIGIAKNYFGEQCDIYIDGGDKSSAVASHLINLANHKTLR